MKKSLSNNVVTLFIIICLLFSLYGCNLTVEFEGQTGNDSGTAGTSQTETVTDAATGATRDRVGGPYDVIRVVDGDTIIIDYNGKNTRVRFSNVDTPESVAGEETGKVNTEEGYIASDYTKNLLPEGSKVYLELDNKTRDKYDRLLAYVYLDDGTMIQRLLLKEGIAKVFDDKSNKRYTEEFYKLQDEAKSAKLGIWAGEQEG